MTTTETPIRILLIDDDPDQPQLLRALLNRAQSNKYILDATDNYEQGLAAITEHPYDVLLVDPTNVVPA